MDSHRKQAKPSGKREQLAMTSNSQLFPDWDHEQLEVILDDPSSWQLVAAGPGTGKTAVACQRIASLVDDGISPSRILLVSFTRTAVAELRDRIVSFAAAGEQARSVRISTVDSYAWRLRAGFENETQFESLSGSSYELNIQQAIALFRSQDLDLLEFMDGIEHLIIDEAQDVVGIRGDLIIEMLRSLSGECGVTILADPAQAIYGFTSDDKDEDALGSYLLERLEEESPRHFVTRQLKQIHRVQDPRLLNLFRRTRDVVEMENDSDKHIRRVVSTIRETAIEDSGKFSNNVIDSLLEGLGGGPSLVLFRRRADVLMASSYLSNASVQHRLRMSGTPMVIRPWIGWLFADFEKDFITFQEYDGLWKQRSGVCPTPFKGEQKEGAWKLLQRLAAGQREGVVDLVYLRKLLSRARPPIEVCYPDLGIDGPILGTIHASKGREADTVKLILPSRISGVKSESQAAAFEEGRVYYVGATRAREKLITALRNGLNCGQLESGRVYRKITGQEPPRVQFEIGRENDVDRLAHLAWWKAGNIQQILAESCRQALRLRIVCRQDLDFAYRLELSQESSGNSRSKIDIGQMGKPFCSDLNEVWSYVDRRKNLKPGKYINHIYLIGATTVALSDSERSDVRAPYSRSGFALAPVVKGFSSVQFLFRKWKGA